MCPTSGKWHHLQDLKIEHRMLLDIHQFFSIKYVTRKTPCSHVNFGPFFNIRSLLTHSTMLQKFAH